jgi:SAM-dependent methyltransferase
MPSLKKNIKLWNSDYDWSDKGEEWSRTWSDSQNQWDMYLYPRIRAFLPADSILEIGCGFGKWTQFLKEYTSSLTAIDLSAKCIDHCKDLFRKDTNVSLYVNDGVSLDAIKRNSADFVFSFDSLVHADKEVINRYIQQIPAILKENGVAFIHHSNLGSYPIYKFIESFPKLPGLFSRLGMGLHWRDTGVSAKFVNDCCNKAGLKCISQELMPWDRRKIYTDCISVIVKDDSGKNNFPVIYKNSSFGLEIDKAKVIKQLYYFPKDYFPKKKEIQ